MMIDIVFGLHLYQPPNQMKAILKKITEESYLPLIDLILSHPKAIFTVDVARSAIENLIEQDTGRDFLEKVRKALSLKKIQLVNTAAYHPILPLLPKKEIIRQAMLNKECYEDLLPNFCQKPEGFFPPEMAFSQKLVSVLRELGYQWVITDDTPFVCFHKCHPPFNWIPQQKGIAVFLRSHLWSARVAFASSSGKSFTDGLRQDLGQWFGGNNGYLIIWIDWETFGHHRANLVKDFLLPLLANLGEDLNLVSPSALLSKYPQKEVSVPPGSWSTSAEDFRHKNYWPLWKNSGNQFHQLWWEMAKIVLEIKNGVSAEKKLSIFDKALYSCQTWQFSMGNKSLAINGMAYFKDIVNLEESQVYKEKIKILIERLESLCK